MPVPEKARRWWDAGWPAPKALPHVHIPQPSESHFDLLGNHLATLGVGGNLTTEAHLATLAIERGHLLASTDSDFSRFSGLKWTNPCR